MHTWNRKEKSAHIKQKEEICTYKTERRNLHTWNRNEKSAHIKQKGEICTHKTERRNMHIKKLKKYAKTRQKIEREKIF